MNLKEIKKIIKERLIKILESERNISTKDLKNKIEELLEEIRKEKNINLITEEKNKIIEEMADEILGYGPLTDLMKDESVTEIMINGPYKVYIEKDGKKILTDIKFDSERHLRYIIERLLSHTRKRVDELSPYVDFSLPDGSRVNIIIPPVAPFGPMVTIRKFLKTLNTIEDLINLGTLDERMAQFLIACVKAKINIIFSGATGAGKTTTLNILSNYISEKERIIVIEDALELRLSQEHVVRLEARQASLEGKGEVSIRDLFINSLRMRPDRIILGEIRGKEALDLLQAISSGHVGSLAVIHASSPQDTISRLELMVLSSGINFPLWALRKLISDSIDLIVQHEQLIDGSRKITYITEVEGVEREEVILRDIFYFDLEEVTKDGTVKGKFRSTGVCPKLIEKFKKFGIKIDKSIFKR